MNVLSLNIIPSPISNDHQVRLLVDNEDWLGDEYLGVDPTDFFDQTSFVEGLLLVGRCDCGVLGCENVLVDATSTNDTVHWKIRRGPERADLEFARDAYSEMLERARNDFSWEDDNRRTERVIGNMFINHKIDHVYEFEWASCRIEDKKIVIAFRKPWLPEQKFLELDWDGVTEDSAITQAEQILKNSR